MRLNCFIGSNAAREGVVVIQGLGFVGAVMSLVCANALTKEYAVLGVDLSTEESLKKIELLNSGTFPIVADDSLIEKFYRDAMSKGNFMATCDISAYSYADVIIVDINLDVNKYSKDSGSLEHYSVTLDGFKEAIRTIGRSCKEDVLVLIETTVPPGTCLNVVKPILEEELAKRSKPTNLYKLGHSYERVMPGPDYINSIRSYPRVYSGIDDRSADAVEQFLHTIIDTESHKLTRLGSTNATEMAKVLENSYRAMNIAFAVEWSRFAEEAGVNLYEIVDAIRVRKTHANLMYPGIGVGGYCLTKDPLLASWSRQSVFGSSDSLAVSEQSVSVNDQMPRYAFERLSAVYGQKLDGCNITILGVSYRGDVGDTRFTPVYLFVKLLKDVGANLAYHDPFVRFWPEHDEEIEDGLEKAISDDTTIAILSTGHSYYKTDDFLSIIMRHDPLLIFDTIGILSSQQINILSGKHRVSVLGRGDL